MISAILEKVTKILRNTKPMNLNEWAETHGQLSAESSAEPGKWKSIPYQVEMMNAISDVNIQGVVIKKSARVGYTKILTHAIGYFIEHKPSSILIVQPTDSDAEGFSKEELAPYIRDVECIRNLVSDAKAKDGSNSMLLKMYPGGVLSVIGAVAPKGFRRISRRIILLDEVSGYPDSAGPEGSPVKLAIRRSEYFWDRKIVAGSTPTLTDECKITDMFEETDQRRFFVPCPICGHKQYLQFKNLKWLDDPREAFFQCEKNKCVIEHKHKRDMIEKGEWIATAESKKPKWVGFHIWAAYSYSPNSTWGDIACEFLEAKTDREKLKTFVNTVMGETFDDSFLEKTNMEDLSARAEAYPLGTAPEGVLFCVAGVDIQDNRAAVSIFGYGHNDECWVLNHMEIFGNPAESALWKSIDAILGAPIIHEKYQDMYVRAAAIDSGGHFTHETYQFTRERRDKNYIAIKGASQSNKPAIGKPVPVDINYRGKSMKRGGTYYPVGTDTIKSVIYSRLKIQEKGAKYIHFSAELTADYYKQLQSERKIKRIKNGRQVMKWEKNNPSDRNEGLDTFVYGFAAKELVLSKYPKKLAYEVVEKELKLKSQTQPVTVKVSSNKKKPPQGGGFVKSW